IAWIEQARVANHKIAFRNVSDLAREALRPSVVRSLLGFLQLRYRLFERSLKYRKPARHVCGRVANVIEPDRLRRKRKPDNAVLSDFRFSDLELACLLDVCFAGWQ